MAQMGMVWMATFVSQIQMHLAEKREYKRKRGWEKITKKQVEKILDEYQPEDRKLMHMIVLMMRGLKEPCNGLAYDYFDDQTRMTANHAEIERKDNVVDVGNILKAKQKMRKKNER